MSRRIEIEIVRQPGLSCQTFPPCWGKWFDDSVRYAVLELTENERSILLLRVIGEFRYRDISEILGLPEGTVMGLLSKERKKLRIALFDYAVSMNCQTIRRHWHSFHDSECDEQANIRYSASPLQSCNLRINALGETGSFKASQISCIEKSGDAFRRSRICCLNGSSCDRRPTRKFRRVPCSDFSCRSM